MDWTSSKQWIIGTDVMLNKLQCVETLIDYAKSLRDGMVLCGILNKMIPGCIDYNSNIEDPDYDEFSCQRNISSFLHTCEEKFGIREERLFSADDLYELQDFRKVLSALSTLSHTVEAVNIQNWVPFDICLSDDEELDVFLEGNELQRAKSERISSSSYIPHLPERICSASFSVFEDELCRKQSSSQLPGRICSASFSDFDEDLYPDQSACQLPERILSASFTDFDEEFCPKGLQRTPSSQRDYVISEILETEKSYLNQLHILVGVYIPALDIYLTEEEREKIFLNIEDICMLHQSIYDNLKTQYDMNNTCIDFSVLLYYKKRFLVYAYYCSFLDHARLSIDRLANANPAFQDAVEDLNKENNMRHASLSDFLSICFQRIMKYPLLLKRLKRKSTEDENNWSHVQEALESMQDVAAYIDEYKKDITEKKKIKEIQDSLQFSDDSSTAVRTAVVKIGTLWPKACDYLSKCDARLLGRSMWNGKIDVRYQENEAWTSQFAFLFEHVLLICKVKQKGEIYQVQEVLKLKTITLERVDFTSFKDQASGKTYFIHVKNKMIEKSWMASFGKCMNIIREVSTKCKNSDDMHILKLTTFDESDYECCGVCGLLLLGLIDQGYLCEECQLRVHEDCI